MAIKAKNQNPFIGSWRIVSMSTWSEEYVNKEVPAYIEFDADGCGSFQFGYVRGQIDHRTTNRGAKPAVEFSWEGGDGANGSPLTGRGWAILEDGELSGMMFIHLGDDSEFVAKKAKDTKRKKHS